VGDEVFGPVGQSLGNETGHRFQTGRTGLSHESPLIGRLGGARRGGGSWLGVGGGLGGRFSF
jgi:hypothetical protein